MSRDIGNKVIQLRKTKGFVVRLVTFVSLPELLSCKTRLWNLTPHRDTQFHNIKVSCTEVITKRGKGWSETKWVSAGLNVSIMFGWLFLGVLWHINFSRLFNAEYIFTQIIICVKMDWKRTDYNQFSFKQFSLAWVHSYIVKNISSYSV